MYNITIVINSTLNYVRVFNDLVKGGFNPHGKGRRISCVNLTQNDAWDIAEKGDRYWFW